MGGEKVWFGHAGRPSQVQGRYVACGGGGGGSLPTPPLVPPLPISLSFFIPFPPTLQNDERRGKQCFFILCFQFLFWVEEMRELL